MDDMDTATDVTNGSGTLRSPASTPTLIASSGQAWQAMRIKALRQGDDPAARSRTLARRLIDIVNLSDYLVMVRVS